MILDQHGYPFMPAAQQRYNRPYQNNTLKDYDDVIKGMSHRNIIAAARKMYNSFGVIKGSINNKAQFVTGKAWQTVSRSANDDFATAANEFNKRVLDRISINGDSWQDVVYDLSVNIDRDGDCGILIYKDENDRARIKLIPAHRIDSRMGQTHGNGIYAPYKMTKGVCQDKYGRNIAYQILGDSEDYDLMIPANSLILCKDNGYSDSCRGLSLFSHALDDIADIKTSRNSELTTQVLMSAISFIEQSDDDDTADPYKTAPTTSDGVGVYTLEDGSVKVYTSDQAIKEVTNNRPSPAYREFQDILISGALAGAGWCKALIGDMESNGTATRLAITIAENSIMDRQQTIKAALSKVMAFVYANAIKRGELKYTPDFFAVDFRMPRKISIDLRDARIDLEKHSKGLISTQTLLSYDDITLEDFIDERISAEMLWQDKIKDAESKGYTIDKRRVQGMLTPNDQPEQIQE